MPFTTHIAVATVLSATALGLFVPELLNAGNNHAITVETLSVPADAARPTLATADHAISPLVPKYASLPEANPFVMREKGVRAKLPIPEPPPPPLALPEPPPTPFAPGR